MAMNFFRKRSKPDGVGNDWKATGSFVRKPVKGWLHSDRLLESSGVTYEAKYIGAVKIIESMRNVPFEHRGAVVREAISRCCLQSKLFNFKPSKISVTHGVVGDVDLQNCGDKSMITFSKTTVKAFVLESGVQLFQHPMESISFASLGEGQYENLVAYVAKDSRLERGCFIFECAPGLANDLILTIGQAFELKYKDFLNKNPVIQPVVARFGDPSSALNAQVQNRYEDTTPKEHTYSNHHDFEGATAPEMDYDHLANNNKRLETQEEQYNTLSMNTNGLISPKHGPSIAPGATFMGPDQSVATVFDNPISKMNAKKTAMNGHTSFDMEDGKRKANKPENIKIDNSSTADESMNTRHETMYLVPSPSQKIKQKETPLPPSSQPNTPSQPTPPTPTAPPRPNMKQRLKISEKLQIQSWFHGVLSRDSAEGMIHIDGEFLVRESGGSKGQYVLTGMRNGTHRHLLLVDPEGKVRTRDHSFDTVVGLIAYHMTHNIPICSGSSEVYLIHEIHDLRRDPSQSFAI
ncbi:SHC-transforming protein 1-like [Clytia hemisphaerica]|uniref:Uncharacterized protein n=1 Tax=Clytia hemisphaerica TaxID=252671 RepID=A0A7M5UXM7_9CNID